MDGVVGGWWLVSGGWWWLVSGDLAARRMVSRVLSKLLIFEKTLPVHTWPII